jgi:hypothetical protein
MLLEQKQTCYCFSALKFEELIVVAEIILAKLERLVGEGCGKHKKSPDREMGL